MHIFVLFVALCHLTFGFPFKETVNNEVSDYKNYPELYSGYFQGDIKFSKKALRNGLLATRYRWQNNVIPYMFSNKLSFEEESVVRHAMHHIQEKTCLKFSPRSIQTDYVHFINNEYGCYSYVGRIGGEQQLNLGLGCSKYGTAIHQLLHVIGFVHEHSRTDRDDYVTIMYSNIEDHAISDFDKYNENVIENFGEAYDYGSIMHFGRKAFSINGQDTIVPKDPRAQIGQRDGLSVKDIAKIKKMYNCT